MDGKVIKGIAGFYYVSVAESGIYECRAKGIFRKLGKKPLVGDNVRIEVLDEEKKEGNLIEILDRSSEMHRPAAANVDQALIIFALKMPDPNFLVLDRFLISMQVRGIPAAICINKDDTADADMRQEIRERYADAGCPLFFISVKEGRETDQVKEFLAGKTTILAGPSGVGKSSFTNYLLGKNYMETGEISRKLKRGKNTTRHTEIVPLGNQTFLMDTPGFSLIDTEQIKKEELDWYFQEFRPYIGRCRFQGCAHIQEPDCAVKHAVENQQISGGRYENYRYLYEELKDNEKRRY
ncbi:MAG: ribosome small subunit-dependent GTPase A [Lachnospiraceae bacterium]|nr:ribosome small subunit-dependent GTPase A [Lachnospiraceae bacterium]